MTPLRGEPGGQNRRSEALRWAARELAEAGVADARTDARLFLCAAAGIDRAGLMRDPDLPLAVEALAAFESFVTRRAAREPVSRILDVRAFWGLDLAITADVLDPRPDTETLVEAVLDHIGTPRDRPWRILDLGTGSGAILCALLHELPSAWGWGIDVSVKACRVARLNLDRTGSGARSLVVRGNWGAALAPERFDFVVSNPPYIAAAVIPTLDPEVRLYDPVVALDGGADGLMAYRALSAQLPTLLTAGGAVFLEVGSGQAAAVADLLAAAGLRPGGIRHDLAGHERVVSATQDASAT